MKPLLERNYVLILLNPTNQTKAKQQKRNNKNQNQTNKKLDEVWKKKKHRESICTHNCTWIFHINTSLLWYLSRLWFIGQSMQQGDVTTIYLPSGHYLNLERYPYQALYSHTFKASCSHIDFRLPIAMATVRPELLPVLHGWNYGLRKCSELLPGI